MKKSSWLISLFSIAVAATSLVVLVALAGGGFWPVMLGIAALIAMVAIFMFRRPYAARHRPGTADKPELGVSAAPGQESISLIEHLSARAPEALESADLQALFAATLEYAAASLPATDILLLDMDDRDVTVRLARGRVREYVDKQFRLAESVKVRLDEHQVLSVPDIRAFDSDVERGRFPALLVETGLRALLLAKTCRDGVLALASTRRDAFSAYDVAFLESVSAQLDYICAAQQRAAATETKLEERTRLMRFIDELAEAHEAAPVIEEMLAWAVKFLAAESGSIMVVDHSRAELKPVASVGMGKWDSLAPVKIGEGVVGWVAKSKKPIVVEEMPDVSYSVYFPVLVRGEVWAVASLAFPAGSPRFDQKDLDKVRHTIERIMSLAEPFSYALDARAEHVATISALVELSESRNRWRRGHAARVRALAGAAGRRLQLNEDDLNALEIAALLHAFGYLAVDPELLTASRILGPGELAEIRSHASIAADYLSMAPELDEVIPIVRHHHEHYDGSGYNGLKGDQIPLGARILAVADAYEAMISPRPHRPAISADQAVRELNRQAGADFDPQVVSVVSDIVTA